MKCKPGYLSFYLECVLTCPITFHPHPLIPDLCTPAPDTSTRDSPATYYVSSSATSGNLGSSESPFSSLSQAFAAAHSNFVRIYLLSGTHILAPLQRSPFMHARDSVLLSLSFRNSSHIEVRPLHCWESLHAECVSERYARVMLDNLQPATFSVWGEVSFRYVIFSGDSNLVKKCTGEFCSYCRYVIDSMGTLLDDRQEPLGDDTFVPQSVCDSFHPSSLFSIRSSSSLSLENVQFLDFRQQFGTLLSLTRGSLQVTNCTFRNIHVETAVIAQTLGFPLAGTVALTDVLVELLNNGYEYRAGVAYAGFLSSESMQAVSCERCSFRLNQLGFAGTLIYVRDFLSFYLADVTLEFNIGQLVRVESAVSLPTDVDGAGELVYQGRTHILVSHCSFVGNSGNALIVVRFAADLLNVRVENCTFDYCVATSVSGLLSFASSRTPDDFEVHGAQKTVISAGVRLRVDFPSVWVRVTDSVFTHCGMYQSQLLGFTQLANVVVARSMFIHSGDNAANINEATLSYFAADPQSYMKKVSDFSETQPCASVLSFRSVHGLEFTNSTLRNITCEGSAGAVGSGLFSLVSVAGLQISGCSSKADSLAAVLDFSVFSPATFTQLSITENFSNSPAGLVRVTASACALISDSNFSRNSAPVGGALQCTGCCFISGVSVVNNTASGVMAAGLVYSPLSSVAELRVEKVVFRGNSGRVGGAVMVTDSLAVPAPIQLTIQSSDFLNNQAEQEGACMYIASSVRLTNTSLITRSLFAYNNAGNACIRSYFQAGVLTIDQSVFRNNTGVAFAVLYTSHPAPSLVVLLNTLIECNSAQHIIGYYTPNAYTSGISRNITFQFNTGRGFLLQWAYWTESGSVFRNNSAPDWGPAFLIKFYCVVQIRNASFEGNTGGIKGSVLFMSAVSFMNLSDSRFVENVALTHGGAIYTDQYGSNVISNCVFLRNRAAEKGSAINFFSGTLFFSQVVIASLFQDNESGGGTISAIIANITLIGCTVVNNRATEAPGVLAYIAEVHVRDCVFANQSSPNGSFLNAPASSQIWIENTKFEDGQATERGAAIFVSSSTLAVTSCQFLRLSANIGAAITIYADSQFLIYDCSFALIIAPDGGALYVSDSSGQISASVFRLFYNSAIVAINVGIVIDECQFVDGRSTEGAALLCEDCSLVNITNSECKRLDAAAAVCFSLKSSTVVSPYWITNCTLEGNRGMQSGAVWISNVDSAIIDSRFENNSASSVETSEGDGGALSLSCAAIDGCQTLISNCTFVNNSASRNGGAIYWKDYEPQIKAANFQANRATYGSDVASFAVRLSSTSNAQAPSLTNLPSGQPSPETLQVALVDHYGQTIATDSESLADLFPMFPENTTVTGATRVVAKEGVFTFGEFLVTYKPGGETTLKVQTNGIDVTIERNRSSPDLAVSVNMRYCEVGESELSSNVCFVCPSGKFSLSPTEPCQDCPTGAECLGKSQMYPLPGYWRSSARSSVFWACPNPAACLGWTGNDTNLSPNGNCSEGYFGNMCNGCLSGYSRSSRSKCNSCMNFTLSLLSALGIGVVTLIVIVFVIKMSLISAQRSGSQYSVYLKVFLNYLQLVTVVASFNLAWPSELLDLLKAQESAGSVSDQAFTFDCFLDSGSSDNQQQVVFMKLVLVAALPLFLFAAALGVWGVAAACRRKVTFLKYQLVNSVVVLFFIAHPSIVRIMFDAFNCREIDKGEFWMSTYMNIRCWQGDHSKYSMSAALPSILLWGVFTPTAALLAIYLNRRRLDVKHTKIRLGFLYNGYQPSKFYWEFVILYRKVLMIIFSVFLANISIPVQALCVMLVLLAAFLLQMKQSPYLTAELNELEIRGILVGAVTVFCGLFFLTNDLNREARLALFAVVVIANAYFLGYWLKRTCHITMQLVRRMARRRGGESQEGDQRSRDQTPAAVIPLEVDNTPKVPDNSVIKDNEPLGESAKLERALCIEVKTPQSKE